MNTYTRIHAMFQIALIDIILLTPLLGWSLWMLSPWWNSLTPVYSGMYFWSHTTWGMIAFCFALVHILGIWHNNTIIRRTMLLVGLGFWVAIAWMIGLNTIASTGIPTYGSIALWNGIAYLRLKR